MYPICSTLSRLNPKFLNTEGPSCVSLAANFVFNCELESMSVSVFCRFFCVFTVLHVDRKPQTLNNYVCTCIHYLAQLGCVCIWNYKSKL